MSLLLSNKRDKAHKLNSHCIDMEDKHSRGKEPRHGEIEEVEDEVEKRFKRFKNFDMFMSAPRDHHYLPFKRNHLYDFDRTFSYNIAKEWELLEANLPKTIFVRVYDRRYDFMRAVIIGPNNTPYRHGLFFFDILFPLDYPARPPQLFYHSCGLQLNPNLHKTGEVDLQESWNPKESSILKLLISIQRVILNANNKDVFTSTCETMLYMMRRPLEGFEDFVKGYFRHCAHSVLMNFRGHMDHNEAMKKLFLRLYKAFENNGTYCKHHLTQRLKAELLAEEERKKEREKERREKAREDNGFGMELYGRRDDLYNFHGGPFFHHY